MVSQDPLIPKMLSHHVADVVISSGGLTALAGLAESADIELELPIKIVEVTKGKLLFNLTYTYLLMNFNIILLMLNQGILLSRPCISISRL